MKKQLSNAIGKKVFTILTASVLFIMSASDASALTELSKKVNKPAEITYKGTKDNNLVLKVDYLNELAQPFELQIRNEYRELIYSKKFGAVPLSTDLYFTEIPEDCKLEFAIVTGKEEVSQTFSINTNFKTVKEFAVKEL